MLSAATIAIATVIVACASLPAQPETVEARQLKRVEDSVNAHGDRITELGELILDDRFDALSADMAKMDTGNEKNADEMRAEMKSGLDDLKAGIAAMRKQLQILTIIISTVAGGGVLGGGVVYKLKDQGKTPPSPVNGAIP